MKEKKNLDRLFQEKFKDFEAHPSDQVWKNIIAAKAKKKEDRKIAVIWWRLGGVAAVLLLLITTGTIVLNSPSENTDNSEPGFVQTEKEENPSTSVVNAGTDPSISTDQVDQDDDNSLQSNTSPELIANTSDPKNNTTHTNTSDQEKEGFSFENGNIKNDVTGQNKTTTTSQQKSNHGFVDTPSNTSVQSPTEDVTVTKGVQETPKRSDLIDPTVTIDQSTEEAIAVTTENTEITEEKSTEEGQIEEGQDDQKKSLVEEAARIAANEAEEDETQEKDAIARRWDVGAVAAPVFYGDFGGSGIDPQFKDNSKTSDLNLSYGVQVSYAVSSKFKVRTGVSNVDLNYNTQDISFTASNTARTLRGIDFSQGASFLDITDRVDPSSSPAASEDGLGQGGNSVSNGEIQQNVGYIEIPLEAVYVLSDKRLGVEFIGGVSTLLLNNNEVFLESNGLRTNLGTSNALNDVSFTTNVGVGLNYKITEKIKINVEPSFKYQLNAYSNSVGEFKPYYVGIYTGVNYRF